VFNQTTDGTVCITISSSEAGQISLKIYNSAGEHIKTLYDENLTQPLLPTTINWDGSNKYGQKVASGVYIIYMSKPTGRILGRLVVIH
jgi:flagellar hook assembly protein FlgD